MAFINIKHLKEILFFSFPIIMGQMGHMLFGVGDILVAARYSNEVVSALGIAVGIMAPLIMFGLGISFAIAPIASKNIGEQLENKNESILFTSSLGAIFLSIFLYLILILIAFNIDLLNYSPNISKLISEYLIIAGFSIIPSLLYQVHKEFLQAHDDIMWANLIVVLMNVVNIFLNIVLMFGLLGFPELGIKGAAWATNISRTLIYIFIKIYTLRKYKTKNSFNKKILIDIFQLGAPIAFGTLIEVLVFSAVTILIGRISILASASHNIVLNMASLTFMIPLAISSAASVKLSRAYGKKDLNLIKSYSANCVLLSALIMIFTASFYFAIPTFLVSLTTDDTALIHYASALLFFVGLFQIPDGIQITLLGILRGLGETKKPMIFSFSANWLIGLPFGHYLATSLNKEAAGYWAGLALGLTMMCIFLSFLYKKIIQKIALEIN